MRKAILKDYFLSLPLLALGALLYSAGVSLFLDPNSVVSGGVTGISIMLSRFLPLKVGTLVLLFNVPLLILGFLKLGKAFFAKTITAVLFASGMMNFLERFEPLTKDLVLAALAGGTLLGAGIGIVFRAGGTTGGTDIVVRLIKLKYKHIKTGRIFLALDGVIVLASGLVFGDWDFALYGMMELVVDMYVLDLVLYGRDEAMMVFIVSHREEEIMKHLLSDIDVGASFLKGTGGYTGTDERIILCAMKKNQFPKVQDIVKNTDESAFMIVTSASEIFGKGFKGYQSETF